MRNYFTLNGVDSRDFGVYISGQGTFSAPSREYNLLPVPGRNGDLVGPEKRFANGVLTYPAFIYTNFDANIEAFRNFLLSLVGYHDLVDSYHPDEIRKVLFQGPFEPEVESKNDAGRFDLEFICKPQRYLASGNEVTTFESASVPETFSGSTVTFDNPGGATVSAISTAINPIQDLHGYDSPWPAGGGKNLLNPHLYTGIPYNPTVGSTVTLSDSTEQFTDNGNGVFTLQTTVTWEMYAIVVPVQAGQTYYQKISFSSTGTGGTTRGFLDANYTVLSGTLNSTEASQSFSTTMTPSTDAAYWFIVITNRGTASTTLTVTQPQIEVGSSASAWQPYANICPISGLTGANIVVSPTLDAQDGTVYPISWQTEAGTVYGGTLNVLTGVLTVTHGFADLGELTWNKVTSDFPSLYCSDSLVAAIGATDERSPHGICSRYRMVKNRGNAGGYGSAYQQPDGSMRFRSSDGRIYVYDSTANNGTGANFKSMVSGAQLAYELATPQTYQLTPEEVALLTGTNNVWSDTGDITATITFPQDQFTITNPTLFDSQPLMRVYGVGALGVGSQTVTITQADVYTDIDCEMMDAFKGTANKNPYVQFTDHNFPVFVPGVNNISLGTGITKVEITPRWWIV